MRLKFFFITVFNITCCFLRGQSINQQLNFSTLFADGIYINNLNLFIPWNIPYDSILNYGNPKVFETNRGGIEIVWDSVEILNNIKGTLKFIPLKSLIGNKYSKFTRIGCFMDSNNIKKTLSFFQKNLGSPRVVKNKRREITYLWNLNHCNIFIEKFKYSGVNLMVVGKYVYQR